MTDVCIDPQFVYDALLPERALLAGISDLLVPVRRQALNNAAQLARDSDDPDAANAASIELCWEACTALELAARIARLSTHPIDVPTARWAQLTHYEEVKAHQFYEGCHRWTKDRFRTLTGAKLWTSDGYVDAMTLLFADSDPRLTAALEAAWEATSSYLQTVLANLASGWRELRKFSLANEHGFLQVPESLSKVVNSDQETLNYELLVWETRKEGAFGTSTGSRSQINVRAARTGKLALAFVEHVIDMRGSFSDSVDLAAGDGRFKTNWRYSPVYWFPRGAVPDSTLEILRGKVTLEWAAEPDVGTQ